MQQTQAIPLGGYWQLLHRYLRPQQKHALLMATLLLAGIGFQLAAPQVLRTFINAVKAGAPHSHLTEIAAGFIALAIAGQAIKVLASYWSDRVAWTALNALRIDLTAHLLRLDASFHKERTPGELIERVDGDVSALAGFLSSIVIKLAGSALLLGGVLVALTMVHLWLGVLFLAFSLAAMAVMSQVRAFATPLIGQDRERSAAYYGYISEVIAATEDLRSSGATGYAIGRLKAHLSGWMSLQVRSAVRSTLVWVTAIVAFAIGDGIAYGFGGGLYLSGRVPLGTVYLVIAYAALLSDPLETLRSELQNLQKADASIQRIRSLLAIKPRVKDGDEALPEGALSVDVSDLAFRYDEDQAEDTLQEISLRLKPGRKLGLLGRTGSGKSTLARLLVRQYDPTAGAVLLGGVDLRQAKLKELREKVALVTQEVQIFAASLRGNLTIFDPSVPDERLRAVLENLGLGEWLARLPQGLDTEISGASLSAGEAQLLAFARIFLRDPGLVILDEASSRLDPATEMLLTRAMERLLEGRTAIIIAHRMATVEKVDEVMILEGGRVLEHGERERLARDPHSRFAALRQMGMEEALR